MILKKRIEPAALKLLKFLSARTNLPDKELDQLYNLQRGLKGEHILDSFLEKLPTNVLILNDLLLESNNTLFQIDSLVITQDIIYLFEVKNYEGDYFIQDEKWYTKSKFEIKNPLAQLERSGFLFRKLLQELHFKTSINSQLIFINPQFFLYQAPMNKPIIFSSQLNQFMQKLSREAGKLNDKYINLANQLISLHIEESPYKKIPEYHFNELQKGIPCSNCGTLFTDFERLHLICKSCGGKENISPAILRSIDEFYFLFPERRITTNTIQEWCKVVPKKTIRRILSRNFKQMGNGKSSYFIRNE